jgi:hypothetical protein
MTVVVLSLWVYRLLLAAYPREFRREYGAQMQQVFGDCCRRATRRGGAGGLLGLWSVTLLDFVRSLVEAHLHRETTMTRDNFIRFCGWALVLGGVTFALFWIDIVLDGPVFGPSGTTGLRKQLQAASFIGSSICLGLGMLGLSLQIGRTVSRVVLFFGAAAALLTIPVAHAQEVGQIHPVWLYVLPLIWSLCLVLVGAVSLRHRAEMRRGGLPLLTGSGWPLALAAYALDDLAPGIPTQILMPLGLAGFAVVAVGCVLLGHCLMAGWRRPVPAA